MKNLFDIIPAQRFFREFCPKVTNWTHKRRKMDGNKRPIDFTHEDRVKIEEAKQKLIESIKKATV